MKSQRRQNQSVKKSRQNRNNNQSNNQNKNRVQKNQNQNQNQQRRKSQNRNQQKNKSANKNQQANNRQANKQTRRLQKKNTRSQKRLQRQRNNKRVTRKNKRSQRQQKKNRNKKSQRGGYGSYSLTEIQSILPCNTVNGVSVADFGSTADGGTKICSETVDILDAEHGADDSVTVISELSDFVRGGTTQVINERETGGRGETFDEAQRLLDRVAHEVEYQDLGRLDGVAPNPTRNTQQQNRFEHLGEHATQRWDHLVREGYAGPGKAFSNPVPTPSTA